MFYALAENGSAFADKVSLYVALAPISKMTNCTSLAVNAIVSEYKLFHRTVETLGIYEMLGANFFTSAVGKDFCTTFEKICSVWINFFDNSHPETDDPDRFAVYTAHAPHGTPT